MGRSFTPAGGASTPFVGQELLSAFTAPALSVSVNDYRVASPQFDNASLVSIGATTAVNITGWVGSTPNRELTLLNRLAAAITLKNASGSSQAANRFNFGADVILDQNQAVKLIGLAAGGWALSGVGTSSGGSPAPSTATYLTVANETATLPNSVEFAPCAVSVALLTGNQDVNDSTLTALSFDTALVDTGALWSIAAPTKLIAPTTGAYLATASCQFGNALGVGNAFLTFLVNGTGSAHGYGPVALQTAGAVKLGCNVSAILQLNAGDYIEAYVYQHSGSVLVVNGLASGQAETQAGMARVA